MNMLHPFGEEAGNWAYTNLMLVSRPRTLKVSMHAHLASGLHGDSHTAWDSNSAIRLFMSPKSSNPTRAPECLLYNLL